ncbi:MAG: universal stress protein [Chloroflexota bacterium]
MIHKILLPLDGSDLAEQAIPHAISLAQTFKATLIITRVVQPTYIMAEYGSVAQANFVLAEQQAAYNYLKAMETRLGKGDISVRTVPQNHTLPADGILDLAEREAVDLIVMCTHGRSGLGRWIHGSVASKILQSAPCTVYLVKATPIEESVQDGLQIETSLA